MIDRELRINANFVWLVLALVFFVFVAVAAWAMTPA